jgi:hypothetical protein
MPVSGGHACGRHVGPRLKPVPPVSRPVVPSDRPGISWIKEKEKEGKASQVKSSQVKSRVGLSHRSTVGADKVVVYYES